MFISRSQKKHKKPLRLPDNFFRSIVYGMYTIENKIKAEANRLGFSFLHITHTGQTPHYPAYLSWLNNQFAGEMGYLLSERVQHSRGEPADLLGKARSILVFSAHYAALTQPLSTCSEFAAPAWTNCILRPPRGLP